MVLFRNAGLASVWDWGDSADSGEPTGTPIACDIDCVVGVTAEASILVDSALAVNGARVVIADTDFVTTGAIAVLYDESLAIYEVTVLAKSCDLRAITLNAKNLLADERVAVSNALFVGCDVDAEIRGLVAKQFDLSLRSRALRTVYGDLLISVPNPTLLASDISVAVSGRLSVGGDQRIAVSNSIERLVDCLQSAWGGIEQWSDILPIVGRSAYLQADQSWRIGNTLIANCDVATAITCLMALASDLEIRTTTRLAPDADMRQTVFGVILRESHIIEV